MVVLGLSLQTVGMTMQTAYIRTVNLELVNMSMISTSNIAVSIEKY
jgi:hypothetical protein